MVEASSRLGLIYYHYYYYILYTEIDAPRLHCSNKINAYLDSRSPEPFDGTPTFKITFYNNAIAYTHCSTCAVRALVYKVKNENRIKKN